jgi:hypothetical protein
MTIPKSGLEAILQCAMTLIVVSFALLAIVNLCNWVAPIASSIWLAFVTMIIQSGSKREGGFRSYLTNRLGEVAGRHFVESSSQAAQPQEIRFGYDLFGHRFIQQRVEIDQIESIVWNPGQATDMAGRDMNDWRVYLWFYHNDPGKAAKKRGPYRDQDIHSIGPSTRKDRAEALGLAFVAFLRDAGVELIEGAIPTCFIRQGPEAGDLKSVPPGALPNGDPAGPRATASP